MGGWVGDDDNVHSLYDLLYFNVNVNADNAIEGTIVTTITRTFDQYNISLCDVCVNSKCSKISLFNIQSVCV